MAEALLTEHRAVFEKTVERLKTAKAVSRKELFAIRDSLERLGAA